MHKVRMCLMFFLIFCGNINFSHAQDFPEDILVGFVKIINVSTLDSALPKEPLETWLKGIVGEDFKVEWYVTDYDEDPKAVELVVGFKINNRKKETFNCVILVGNENGINPKFISVVSVDSIENGKRTYGAGTISSLEEFLRRA